LPGVSAHCGAAVPADREVPGLPPVPDTQERHPHPAAVRFPIPLLVSPGAIFIKHQW